MVARRYKQMTVENFLALDREKLDQKYEFRNGHIAMAGGSNNHTLMIGNVYAPITPSLKKSPVCCICRRYS